MVSTRTSLIGPCQYHTFSIQVAMNDNRAIRYKKGNRLTRNMYHMISFLNFYIYILFYILSNYNTISVKTRLKANQYPGLRHIYET